MDDPPNIVEDSSVKPAKYCVCHKEESNFMIFCVKCKNWFHSCCVPRELLNRTIRFNDFLCESCLGKNNVENSDHHEISTTINIQQFLENIQGEEPLEENKEKLPEESFEKLSELDFVEYLH